MAPVRRRTTALLVVAGLLLVAVVGLTWLLVGEDDPGDGTAAGVPLTTAGPAAGAAPATAAGPTTAEGGSPGAGDTDGGDGGSGTSGPPAPPTPSCAGVLSGAEAAAALGGSVARVESRDGFLVRTCTFRAGGDRYLRWSRSAGAWPPQGTSTS